MGHFEAAEFIDYKRLYEEQRTICAEQGSVISSLRKAAELRRQKQAGIKRAI